MRLTRVPMLLILLVALAAFVACGDDDDENGGADEADASPTAATSTAEDGSATATATESPVAADGEITIRDLLGREVTLSGHPQRIVAASPSAIEILYAAGGSAVARSETSVHPEGVAELPSIGLTYAPAFEEIIALQADLVLVDASAQAHLLDAFEGALRGVPLVFVGAITYEDVASSIRLVGQITGTDAEAEAAVAELELAATEMAAAVEGMTSPRVLIINGAIDDFFVALPDSFVGDLAAHLHVDNVAAGQPPAGRFPGYTQLSLETILEADPEVILTITAGPPGGPSLAELVLGDGKFANLAAVVEGRVFDLDVEVYLQAPGPRAADGLRELALLLYGIE